MLSASSRARARKSFTVHVGPAGSITLASRDNEAAGTHRPATLRVGARGSVLRIGTTVRRPPSAPSGQETFPPLPDTPELPEPVTPSIPPE
jgi:hypothetical protein